MHLVDSSSILSILLDDDASVWAESTLARLRPVGGVFINQIVFSEICSFADSQEDAGNLIGKLVENLPLNWECAFPAGKAYRLYKSRGGPKPRMLPDFLIAAHADSLGWALVTNNPRDVRNYFPNLKVIHPRARR